MNTSRTENLGAELEKLENVSGILGTAIVNRNGLLVSSRLSRDIDDRKFGASVATIYGAMETAALTIGKNEIFHLTVKFNDCQMIALGINDQMIMVSMLDLGVNLGFILLEIEEIIKNIKRIIELGKQDVK